MANEPGYRLPLNPERNGGKTAQGFVTPQSDRIPQIHSIPPRRVIPIVFLPGIMGSNLRMSAARQVKLERKNNMAWRPDKLIRTAGTYDAGAIERQNRLDPAATEVDQYEPGRNSTGDPDETSDERNDDAVADFTYGLASLIDTPLLMDDPVGTKPRKLKDQKARERGWGEVFFGSYSDLLEMCELQLNTAFRWGELTSWWKQIVGVAPSDWRAHPKSELKPLDEEALRKAVTGCWFPVHAMGYNWLESNRDSGMRIAKRVQALIQQYRQLGFQCEKVIFITHSMGGLVARAAIHPKMGNANAFVLGVVHGVMPALGAAAAYKRMRCGFEQSSSVSIPPKVLGNQADKVTAVLSNSQGALELLPNQSYGNNWLQIKKEGVTVKSLPQHGDPYEEIYKVRGKWFGLLREEWINPAGNDGSSFDDTCKLLDNAKRFHAAIADTFHDQTFAHYCADLHRLTWHKVEWNLASSAKLIDPEDLVVTDDNLRGELRVYDPKYPTTDFKLAEFNIELSPPKDPGDQTVPLHSAEHQFHCGKLKGVFRQLGYEHQNSYKDRAALHSTIYSIVRIAETMVWGK